MTFNDARLTYLTFCDIIRLSLLAHGVFLNIYKGGYIMAKGKCTEKPPRRGPMTVKVHKYTRKDGTRVSSHKRHTPK